MTKPTRLAIVMLALCVSAALPFCLRPADAQPMPTCSPGQACKVLSLTATKTTGAAISLAGDAGVRFGDGTILNTATGGGATISGSPLAAQIAIWASASAVKGDANLTFASGRMLLDAPTDDTSSKLQVNGDISLVAANNKIIWNYASNRYMYFDGTKFNMTNLGPLGINDGIQAYGAIDAQHGPIQSEGGGDGTNTISMSGSSTGSPVTVTATGGNTNIAISMTGKGTGAAMAQNTGYGAYSGRPTAANAGRVYLASDSPVAEWVDTGSAWAPVPGAALGTQPKAASSFTAFERNTGTVPVIADQSGALHVTLAADSTGGAATHVAGFTESLSSSTAHVEGSVIIQPSLIANGTASSFYGGGVLMRESGSGKFAFMDIVVNNSTTNDTGLFISCAYWASATSQTSQSKFAATIPSTGGPLFFKIARSGSNTLWQISSDGVNYTTLQTVATTTVFTTAPDQVGLGVEITATTDTADMVVRSYNSGS